MDFISIILSTLFIIKYVSASGVYFPKNPRTKQISKDKMFFPGEVILHDRSANNNLIFGAQNLIIPKDFQADSPEGTTSKPTRLRKVRRKNRRTGRKGKRRKINRKRGPRINKKELLNKLTNIKKLVKEKNKKSNKNEDKFTTAIPSTTTVESSTTTEAPTISPAITEKNGRGKLIDLRDCDPAFKSCRNSPSRGRNTIDFAFPEDGDRFKQANSEYPSNQVSFLEQNITCNGSLLEICHMESNKCQKLLQQGPCQENHWLVSVNNTALCTKRKCPNNMYFSEAFQGCVSPQNITCTRNKEPIVTSKGTIDCKCKGSKVPWKDGQCYQLYHRGPCDFREYLTISNSTLQCVINPCRRNEYVRIPNSFTGCHKLETRGPCGNRDRVGFSFKTMELGCHPVHMENVFLMCVNNINSSYSNITNTTLSTTISSGCDISSKVAVYYVLNRLPYPIVDTQLLQDQTCTKM